MPGAMCAVWGQHAVVGRRAMNIIVMMSPLIRFQLPRRRLDVGCVRAV